MNSDTAIVVAVFCAGIAGLALVVVVALVAVR